MTPLAKVIEALLFLSPEPVSLDDLRDATQQDEWAVLDALTELRDGLHGRGVALKEIGGGWTLASHPSAEDAARRLLSRPRTPALTPAQAETLPVVADKDLGVDQGRWPRDARENAKRDHHRSGNLNTDQMSALGARGVREGYKVRLDLGPSCDQRNGPRRTLRGNPKGT